VRRILPYALLSLPWVQALLLTGSVLCNRLLLAPAYAGYYTVCYRLVSGTCVTPLFGCVWGAYRHPLKAMKWQLKWDAFRVIGCFTCIAPGTFLWIWGMGQTTYLTQVMLQVSGGLFAFAGILLFSALLQRLCLFRYQQYRYQGFLFALWDVFRRSKGNTNRLLRCVGWYVRWFPLCLCPFCLAGPMLHLSRAKILYGLPSLQPKVMRSRKTDTRVLWKT
jgi:hypothetical protein